MYSILRGVFHVSTRIYIVFSSFYIMGKGEGFCETEVCLPFGFLASAGIDLMFEYYSYDMCMNISKEKLK